MINGQLICGPAAPEILISFYFSREKLSHWISKPNHPHYYYSLPSNQIIVAAAAEFSNHPEFPMPFQIFTKQVYGYSRSGGGRRSGGSTDRIYMSSPRRDCVRVAYTSIYPQTSYDTCDIPAALPPCCVASVREL